MPWRRLFSPEAAGLIKAAENQTRTSFCHWTDDNASWTASLAGCVLKGGHWLGRTGLLTVGVGIPGETLMTLGTLSPAMLMSLLCRWNQPFWGLSTSIWGNEPCMAPGNYNSLPWGSYLTRLVSQERPLSSLFTSRPLTGLKSQKDSCIIQSEIMTLLLSSCGEEVWFKESTWVSR